MAKTATKVIAGVLAAAGIYFVYKYFTKPDKKEDNNQQQQGGGQGGGQVSSSPSKPSSPSATDSFPLKKGSRGNNVKILQEAIVAYGDPEITKLLGKNPTDGVFGAGTEQAVEKLFGKKTVSMVDIPNLAVKKAAKQVEDQVKKAQEQANQAQAATKKAKLDLAYKLADLAKTKKRNPTAIRNTEGRQGMITTDGRFVQQYTVKFKKGQSTATFTYFGFGLPTTYYVNTASPKYNAYATVDGDLVVHDSNTYFVVNPYDVEIK